MSSTTYRFLLRPKWIAFHLLVVAGIVAMINLGFWQLRRLDEKQAFNAVIEARYNAGPQPLDDLLGRVASDDPTADGFADIEWYPATVTGTYLPDLEFRVTNRSQHGRPGENIVTPLRIDDGRVLLVNRGFVPLRIETAPPPPDGEVSVIGRVRRHQEKGFGQASDATEGPVEYMQRFDIPNIDRRMDVDLEPVYVNVISSQPSNRTDAGLPEPVIAPELGEGNHLSYAVQWFIFSVAVAVGWVLAVRHSSRARQQSAAASDSSAADGSSPTRRR